MKFVKEHERLILKVCNIYGQEIEDREDLYQDIIVQLWKSYPKFEKRSKVSTWMYRIALNTAISKFRKVKKLPQLDEINEQTTKVADQKSSENIELVSQLYDAINSLNKVEKAIVLLYLEECRYKEISEIMGISQSNVGFKINRIKQKLREKLKNNQS